MTATIRLIGETVSLTFSDPAAARKWAEEFKLTIKAPVDPVQERANAVAIFHRQKGCCDGTDPAGCFQRQLDERNRLADEARDAAITAKLEKARRARSADRDEYADTEPTQREAVS